MAEYIEKEKLLTDISNGIRAGNYEDGYEQYQNINNMNDIIETIKYSDVADVVERSKIDEIKREIDKLFVCHTTEQGTELISKRGVFRCFNLILNGCRDIEDKDIGEESDYEV